VTKFEDKCLVLFDGVCNVCDALVLYIIDRDPSEQFVFAPLSSELGRSLLAQHGMSALEFESVVLIEGGRAFSHSTAVLRILARLGGLFSVFWLGFLLPSFLRNLGYRWFAKNRYRWFGKNDQCRVPTPELKRRFLASV
jgi:predicted DCC family thiol-disulfide oxidoreductase YuxK